MLTVEQVNQYFVTRGIQCALALRDPYATLVKVMDDTLELLSQHSAVALTEAVQAFNEAFVKIPVEVPVTELPKANTGFMPLDQTIVTHLKTGINGNVGLNNLITLLQDMYQTTNAYRVAHGLLYHQPRHAIEMFLDNAQLLQNNPQVGHYKLLLALSGLYHDVIFTAARVDDETASATKLKLVLEKVLSSLSVNYQVIIKNIIDFMILAGTTPVFFANNASGEAKPTLEGIYKVVAALNPGLTNNPVAQQLLDLARQLSHCDVNRTSLDMLFLEQSLYAGDHWQLLQRFYSAASEQDKITLQRKLTQDLRVLFEMNVKGELSALALLAAQYQAGDSVLPGQVFETSMITALATAIGGPANPFSEVAFASRMDNSLKEDSAERYALHNTWQLHRLVLEEMHHFLISEVETAEEKTAVVVALAKAAGDQDGRVVSAEWLLAKVKEVLPNPAASVMVTPVLSASNSASSMEDYVAKRPKVEIKNESQICVIA